MTIDALAALIPPPSEPIAAGNTDWPAVEDALGQPLPTEYKQIVDLYGTGSFGGLITLFTPNASRPHLNLIARLEGEPVAILHAEDPDGYPFPPFPEPGGLLAFGTSDNWEMLYWRIGGPPDTWPIIFYEQRGPDYERLELSMSDALVAILSGTAGRSVLPDHWALEVARFEPWEA